MFSIHGFHQAVKLGDRVYDAITGPKGMSYKDYVKKLETYEIHPVVKEVK